ncbi:MAG TPA: tyrosine-type recombinase/integrase [Stellaceae bacterium]|nr:tyrosine-type recombinase/integrase [Stellaceae bacterium]
MQAHNPENERVKHRYFTYLREAKRCGEASLDSVAKALNRYERYTRFRDFRQFHTQQAVGFKRYLAEQLNTRTGDKLSKSTLHSTLNALRNFFFWLAGQAGFRSRLAYSDAEYFNLSAKDTSIAKAHRDAAAPTIEQVIHVLRTAPCETPLDRRNRAVIAFTLLTGIRDRAVASVKLKHVQFDQACVVQDAREVQTKFSKTSTVWFFPVGIEVATIVGDWIAYLSADQLWGLNDPLFPATQVTLNGDGEFEATGLDRKHWSTAAPIRKIFKAAFSKVGMPYFPPHSFRKTLARLGEQLCRTPEEFKAWSQNLSHETVLTTFSSYGEVTATRQAELMRSLAIPVQPEATALDQIAEVLRSMGRMPQLTR